MREVLQVALRAAAFVALWLAFPDTDGPVADGGGAGLWLLALIALVALLWGVVDGLVSPGAMTRTMLRWAATAPAVAVLSALGGGLADGAWLAPVDLLRWTAGLTAMLYFVLVLPAGLGVVTGAGLQSLGRSTPRDSAARR
jgi:hypothetical protein